jgi:hypothetical protein
MPTELTLSDLATVYGCCGLFDMCADEDLMSLHFSGAEPFMDWLGWQGTNICVVKKEFISWVRPDDDCSDGWVSNPCYDANSVEWGKCDFTLEDFGRIRREGPTRDVTRNDVRYCERQPRYRLDGTLVTDDREYDARVITEVIIQDLRKMVITGNATTAGQFDGLQRLVRNGYTNANGSACQMMDSMVVNWNGNTMAGGAGITVNGNAIGANFNFVDVLRAVYRRIRQRINWSPVLGAQQMREGNMILLMPDFLAECLLDFYTCWSVCDGRQYNEANLQTFEARMFRNNLVGGLYGAGTVSFDGFRIPIIAYDWEMINGPTTGDIYLLTGSVGNVKTLMGEYNDMRDPPSSYSEAGYYYTDGGRLLGWVKRDNTCVRQVLEMQPRMLAWAPWALARFQDVVCESVLDPLSPDPCETSFFPQTSFSVAECP